MAPENGSSLAGGGDCLDGRRGPAQAAVRGETSVDHAKLELLRDACFENLGFVRLFAEAAQLHVQGGDDAGLVHSVSMAAAHFRAMCLHAKEIETIRAANCAPPVAP